MKDDGFTLIEVLIALIILAIAFIAVIETSQSSIRDTTRVEQSLGAHWVAMNVMSELQMGLLANPNSDSATNQGTMPMLNTTWSWQINVEQGSQQGFERISIDVSSNGKRYEHLIGFLRI